MSNIVTWSEH